MRATMLHPALALALAAALTLGACDGDQPEPMVDEPMDDMPAAEMPMQRTQQGMSMDPEMMERHADETESMAAEMRGHIQTMRQLSPEEQHGRMSEHAGQVSRMLSMMDRHMNEMGQGMPMDDEHMGAMMGMSAQEHRDMMDQMQGLRSEVEELQTASPSELQQRMPQHLDRTESVVEVMERRVQQMRQR